MWTKPAVVTVPGAYSNRLIHVLAPPRERESWCRASIVLLPWHGATREVSVQKTF